MDLTLKLFLRTENDATVEFPVNSEHGQVLLLNYKYSATRMGNAPSISGTVKYPVLLDREWSSDVYVIHNGERYYLKNTPSSSYDDKSFLYSYNLEFVAERAMLDNIYFFDVIQNPGSEYNVEESEFSFSGDIYMFKDKLNLSLGSSGLYGVDKDKYEVIVDEGIVSESKLFESSNQYITDALNAAYEIYGVPYYFVGKKIHFGNYQNYIDETFECESSESLMSATRGNSNIKIINKITGYGSERNIPYYYPNPTPEGYVRLGGASKDKYHIIDEKKFSSRVKVEREFSCVKPYFEDVTKSSESGLIEVMYPVDNYPITEKDYFFYVAFDPGAYIFKFTLDKTRGDNYWPDYIPILITEPGSTLQVDMSDIFLKGDVSYIHNNSKTFSISWDPDSGFFFIDGAKPADTLAGDYVCTMHLYFNKRRILYFRTLSNNLDVYKYTSKLVKKGGAATFLSKIEVPKGSEGVMYAIPNFHPVGEPDTSVMFGDFTGGYIIDENGFRFPIYPKNGYIFLGNRKAGQYTVEATYNITTSTNSPNDVYVSYYDMSNPTWLYKDDLSEVNLGDIGIDILPSYSETVGDSLCKEIDKRINTKRRLMPSIYRASDGQRRWYMATNDTYKDDNGKFFEFPNEYSESSPKEFIHTIENIYPTISGVTNQMDQRIDMFEDIAFDDYDNNEIYPEDYEDQNLAGKYKHPYFFAKLRKTDGKTRGFNLFDCAIEGETMKISFTSGHVAACEFEIGVDENTGKNPVQVDSLGNLRRDSDGNVIYKGTPQKEQQDTMNNNVWIALKKEDSTMGVMMPDTVSNIVPTNSDTFVILGIHLPNAYYESAEKRLETELIKYMSENNSEKYSFSLKFSSIYLAENEGRIYNILNENSFVRVSYMGKTYEMFVNNYSVSVKEDTLLPEVNVSLTDEIKIFETKRQKIEKLAELANKGLNMSINTTKTSAAISSRTDSIEAKIQSIQKDQGDVSIPELVELVSQNTVNIQEHSERITVLENQTPGDIGPGADFDEIKEWVEETVRGTDEDLSSYITLYGGRAYTREQAEMLLGKDTDSIKNATTLKGLKSHIQKVCNQFVDVDDNVVNMLFYGGAADTDLVVVNIGFVLSFVPNNNFLTRYTIHVDDDATSAGQTRVKITPDNYSRYPGAIVYLKDIADGYDAGLGFSLSVGDMILATERGWKKIGGDNDYIRSLTINGVSKIPDANGDIEFDVVDATFINEYSADDLIGTESIAINSDFFHKVQSAIRDGKLLYIKSFEDATLGYVPFLVEEEDQIYYTIYTAAGFVINGNISEDAITVSNVKHVSDFTAPFLFYWYTLDVMFFAYQNGTQLRFSTDAYDELERAILNNTPIFIKEDEASHIQLNVKCNEVILLSAIDSGGSLMTAEVYRDKIIVTNFTRLSEDISTIKNSLPYSTEFSYEELIDAANNNTSIQISNSIFEAIDLNRRIVIPIVNSRSYYNVRQASYSAGDGFTYRTAELEIAIGDSVKRFILSCKLATDGCFVNVSYINTKLCASTEFKTIFGDSIIGEGDVLGEYTLDIQNTGTYHVESIANARIVRNGVTTPIHINVETHIGNGPSVYVTLSQSGELQVSGTIGGVYLTYLANGTIKDDFIPSTIARTADIKQPDWNESDSSSNAYINNRTHYYSPYVGEYQLVVDDTTKGTNVGTLYDYFKLGGAVYKSADMLGVEFNCQKSGASVFVTVVEELDSDGNPGFYLRHISGNSSAGAPIMISPAGTVKTIDSVFIPDTVARYSKLKTINGQSLEGTGNIVIQASGDGAKWEVRDITYTGQFTTSIPITNRVNPITDKVYYKATAITSNVIVNSILPVQGSMTECKIFIPSAGTSLAAMTVSVNQGINAYWETPKTVTGGAPCELTLRVVTGGENPILLLALKELTI